MSAKTKAKFFTDTRKNSMMDLKRSAAMMIRQINGEYMHTFVLEKISNMYERLDSVIITNKHGVIEYSALFDESDNSMKNEGYTGKNILEVYPGLTEKTSSHYRAVKFNRPIIDEIQTLTDYKGKKLTFVSSTYPIEMEGEVIGAIEGTIYLREDGERFRDVSTNILQETKKGDRLYNLSDIITVDEKMMKIKEMVERVAAGESFVMINGNTGTGKELIAQSLHSHSSRKNEPFVSQNCAAIPAGLLESTLFGTTKGSYTGAENKKGLFELADNGTLFLDEVNSMEISLQGKILKAIEDQKIRRIGDEKEYHVNIRVISAMNEEPDAAIKSGKIREDLFYRLGVVQIHLPDLAERKGDIAELTRHFIRRFNRETHKNIVGLSELVWKMFYNYSWPGNVRELRNAIEYAFNMARGDIITVQEIPERILYNSSAERAEICDEKWTELLKDGMPLTEVVNRFEKMLLEDVLKRHRSVTEAAKELNITRQALNYKLAKFGLSMK